MALAATMGDFRTVIESLDGRLEDILNLSELKAAAGILELHPAIAGMENAVAAQQARVRLATAERIPDLNLDLLYRRLQETREDAFDVGVSVAIPIFDSGRRRVQEAASELRAAEARLEKARNELGRELHSRELALSSAIRTASLLKEDVLPKIETSLRATRARYAAGDVALSELLLVRREASAAQIRYLTALRDVMESWAALKLH
jgi:cobalt-zinc-cadmium efflux system outer membrane protein